MATAASIVPSRSPRGAAALPGGGGGGAATARPRMGSQLYLTQARGILTTEQLNAFKAVLLQVRSAVLSRAELPFRALAIFEQVQDLTDRAMLMRNFTEFVSAEYRTQYGAEVEERLAACGRQTTPNVAAAAAAPRRRKRDISELIGVRNI